LQFKYRNRFVSSDLPQNMKVPLADREQQKPLSRKTTKKITKRKKLIKNYRKKKTTKAKKLTIEKRDLQKERKK
jgi:hypothetical protein